MIPGGRMTESLESRGYSCPYCQGNGFHWQEDEYQVLYKKECPICKGSGRLNAVVTIEWKEGESKTIKSKNNNEQRYSP